MCGLVGVLYINYGYINLYIGAIGHCSGQSTNCCPVQTSPAEPATVIILLNPLIAMTSPFLPPCNVHWKWWIEFILHILYSVHSLSDKTLIFDKEKFDSYSYWGICRG